MAEVSKHPTEVEFDAYIHGHENAATAHDRREAERYVTVLKVGKAVVDGHDQLCLVRNMSRKGMKVMLPHGVKPDQRVAIELRSDQVINGTVRWAGENVAGVEFDEMVPVEVILQHKHTRSVLRQHPRSPRFDRHEKVRVECADGKFDARMINISLHGICIEINRVFRNDERIVVSVEGLPARSANVRWIGHNMTGLHFERPLSYAELSRWLEDHE